MAINMANVKEIHYGNKEIKKIEMNGNVVWQKPQQRRQVTATVSWNRTQVINAVYTQSGTSNKTNSVSFVSEATFKQSCASKLGINVDDIISTGTYKWHNYWYCSANYNSGQNTLMWKKSNSTSGANWSSWSRSVTSSSSTNINFTITTTPPWGTTIYAAFSYKIGSTNYGPYMCSGSNIAYARTHTSNSYPWTFSCVVTYWEYY